MQNLQLQVQPRSITGKKVARLRRAGYVPAVLYGPGISSIPLQVERRSLEQVLSQAGQTSPIQLALDGTQYEVLIRAVQRHTITGEIEHVDFLRVEPNRPIEAAVPIVLTGESRAVRQGGTLIHGLARLRVEARPSDLPHVIQVDLSRLEHPEDSISVRDLVISPNVRVLDEPDELVVKVVPVRVEAEVAPAEALPPTPERPPEETAPPA
jgi:large subunit ribosomal protein L25